MPVRRDADARIACKGSTKTPICVALSRPGRTQCTVHDPAYKSKATFDPKDWLWFMNHSTTLRDLEPEREC